MGKFWLFFAVVLLSLYVVKACHDCPLPPPVVPVFCDWYQSDCGENFGGLDDDFTQSWVHQPDSYPTFILHEYVYGGWYNEVFRFEVKSYYNNAEILVPSIIASALGLVLAL